MSTTDIHYILLQSKRRILENMDIIIDKIQELSNQLVTETDKVMIRKLEEKLQSQEDKLYKCKLKYNTVENKLMKPYYQKGTFKLINPHEYITLYDRQQYLDRNLLREFNDVLEKCSQQQINDYAELNVHYDLKHSISSAYFSNKWEDTPIKNKDPDGDYTLVFNHKNVRSDSATMWYRVGFN